MSQLFVTVAIYPTLLIKKGGSEFEVPSSRQVAHGVHGGWGHVKGKSGHLRAYVNKWKPGKRDWSPEHP